jgi:hypothetical protein
MLQHRLRLGRPAVAAVAGALGTRLVSRAPVSAAAAAAGAAGTAAFITHSTLVQAQAPSSAPPPRPLLEQISTPPPFSPDAERFDTRTFGGRALNFMNMLCDLRTLLLPASECERYKAILAEAAAHPGSKERPSDAELWHAKKVVEAMSHPDTGEVIFAPFRFTGYAPVNLSIAIGMISAAKGTLLATAFWQWFNQSYNVCINHANRPGGGGGGLESIDSGMLASYFAATASAMSLGLAGQVLGARIKGGGLAKLVPYTVPFLSVAVGGVVNLVCTRHLELSEGILVETIGGEPLGHSIAAAKIALFECSTARVLWAGAILTAAPLLAKPIAKRVPPALAIPFDLGFTFVVILFAIPLCLAVYPQREVVEASLLEPRFATHPKTGAPLEQLAFSKGL